MKLRDKVVVVTGSGGGIGAACARRFAAEGAKVVVTDQNSDGVEQVSRSIDSVGLPGDITSEDTVRAVAWPAAPMARSMSGSATRVTPARTRAVRSAMTVCGT